MKNYINWGYDEINDVEYDIPTLKKIDLSKLKNKLNTNISTRNGIKYFGTN